MKRTKRLLLAVLCIALVLAGALTVVAACQEQETGFSLTLSFDSAKGSVTATKPAEGELFDSGEEITVTVTPADNFEVASFRVNGTDAQMPMGGGTYKFSITADTTVAVTFNQKQDVPPASAFEVKASVNYADGADLVLSATSAESGTPVSLTVTVKDGYVLRDVKVNGNTIEASEGKYTFNVTANTEFVVTLAKIVNVYASVTPADSGASITVSAPIHDNNYWSGDEITITVANIPQGKMLEALEVNGNELKATDNTFTYTLTDNDAQVVAYIVDAQIDIDLLASLRGNVAFEGTLTIDYDSKRKQDNTFDLLTIFDNDNHIIYNEHMLNGTPTVVLFKAPISGLEGNNSVYNGYMGFYAHDYSGFLGLLSPYFKDSTSSNVYSYEEISNPFEQLTVSDFVWAGDGVWQLADTANAADFVFRIVGVADTMVSLRIVEEDSGVRIEFVSENQPMSANDPHTFTAYYSLVRSDRTLPENAFTTYNQPTVDQLVLQDALNQASESASYKAAWSVSESDPVQGGTIIVNDNVIFNVESNNGIYRRADNSATNFTVVNDEFAKGTNVQNYGFESFLADFANFDVRFMDISDDNIWSLRAFDRVYYSVSTNTYSSSNILQNLSSLLPGQYLQTQVWQYATNVSIKLDADNRLAQIVVDYTIYYDSYQLVVNFSEWGSAAPAFQLPSDAAAGVVPAEMTSNSWTNSNGDTISVDIDGAVRNNMGATLGQIEKSAEGDVYTVTLNGTQYTVSVNSDGNLVLTDADKHATEYAVCNWPQFFGNYFTFDGIDAWLVDINYKGASVKIGNNEKIAQRIIYGQTTDILGYPQDVLLLLFEDGSIYMLQFNTADEQHNTLILIDDLNTDRGYYIGKISDDWDGLFGTYSYTDSKGAGIVINIGNENGSNYITIATITPGQAPSFVRIADANLAYLYNQSANATGQQLTFFVDGAFSIISSLGDGRIVFDTVTGNPIYLHSISQPMDWSESPYVGSWRGARNGNTYAVTIAADSVTVSFNGNDPVLADVLDYTTEGGFILDVDGEIYYLGEPTPQDGRYYLFDSDGRAICALTNVKNVVFKDEFVGLWVTEGGESQVEISLSTFVNNNLPASDVVFDEESNLYFIHWNGYEFAVELNNGMLRISEVVRKMQGNEEVVTFVQPIDYVPAPIWSGLLGVYTGNYNYNGVEAFVSINFTSTSVTVSGAISGDVTESVTAGVEIVNVEILPGYFMEQYAYVCTFVLDNVTYTLQTEGAYSANDLNTQMLNLYVGADAIGGVYRDFTDMLDWSPMYGFWTNVGGNYGTKIVMEFTEEGIYVSDVANNNVAEPVIFVGQSGYNYVFMGLATGTRYQFSISEDGVWTVLAYGVMPDGNLVSTQGVPYALHNSFSSETGEFIVTINHFGFVVNGVALESYVVIKQGIFSFDYLGHKYLLSVNGQDGAELIDLTDGSSKTLFACDWADFVGIYYSGTSLGKVDKDITIEVRASGVILTYANGETVTASNVERSKLVDSSSSPIFPTYFALLVFQADGVTYQFSETVVGAKDRMKLYENGVPGRDFFREEVVDVTANWTDQVASATYKKDNHIVTFGAEGLAVTVGENSLNIGSLSVTRTQDFVNSGNKFTFTFVADGTACSIELASSANYLLLTVGDASPVRLDKEGYVADWSKFFGSYYRANPTNDEIWIVTVTADGVDVTIDGVRPEQSFLYYDEAEGFVVTIEGRTMYVKFVTSIYGIVTGEINDGEDWSMPLLQCPWYANIGTYTGVDQNGEAYTVIIGAASVIIMHGDEVIIQRDAVDGLSGSAISISINLGAYQNCYISFTGADNISLTINTTDYIVATLHRVEE